MNLDINIKGLDGLYKFMRPSTQNRIVKNTVNKLIVRAKKESASSINKSYNLPKRTITRKLAINRATPYRLKAQLVAPNRRLNLSDFTGTRQTGQGVVATVRRGKRKTYKGAFIAQPKGRDWRRYGQQKTVNISKSLVLVRETVKAYPLAGIQAFTIAQIIGGKWNLRAINKMVVKEGKGIMDKEITKEFKKLVK